jgi:hypothetical protein
MVTCTGRCAGDSSVTCNGWPATEGWRVTHGNLGHLSVIINRYASAQRCLEMGRRCTIHGLLLVPVKARAQGGQQVKALPISRTAHTAQMRQQPGLERLHQMRLREVGKIRRAR